MIGAFELARRPFEYLQVVEGSHMPRQPRPLAASHALTVDWMNFWIRGVETSRPDDPTRYLRWRKIKSDWEAQKSWEARGFPVTSTPNDPDVINAQAYRALYTERNHVKALKLLKENIALHPGSGGLYDGLGEGYVQIGERRKAIEAFENAVALGYEESRMALVKANASLGSFMKLRDKLRESYLARQRYLAAPLEDVMKGQVKSPPRY
jgi:tetratricopeptide (TPR) repeat protein